MRPYHRGESFRELWDILQEFPHLNLDDSSPGDAGAFDVEMNLRLNCGECIWRVTDGDLNFVGAIGVAPYDERSAMFHGICFARSVHGTGLPFRAVSRVLQFHRDAWRAGRVFASFYAHNQRVERFLSKLGFERCGSGPEATQYGIPIATTIMERGLLPEPSAS